MKGFFVRMVLTVAVLLIAGCSGQESPDWYDQSAEQTRERDVYIETQVNAGLSPEEARAVHDSKFYEMNTIKMVREANMEHLDPDSEFQAYDESVEPE